MTEDRISALPDDLLVTILLSLPTKDAVNTLILSKRWRFVWTMLPKLAYEDDDCKIGDGDVDKSKKSVWWFLNNSMEHHKTPLLEILTIKLGKRCPTDANVCKWLETVVNRGVRRLTLELRWLADPTRLPKSLYTCKTLVHLRLSHKILVDFPSSSCLPSLTELLLHEASLVNFLSSCPVLKVLWVVRKEDDNVAKFTVKVPSLQFLCYDTYKPSENFDGRSLVVDTPALTGFHISNSSRDSFSIESSFPCLEYAFIEAKYVPHTDSERFFKSLSNVLSLWLILSDEMVVRFSNIKFSRLIECNITPM